MDEARRFFRYTIPGSIFILELVISFYFSDRFNTVYLVSFIAEKNLFAVLLTAFVSSGILGYIFITIYFFIHWSWFPLFRPLDHGSLIKYLARNRYILLKNHEKQCINLDNLTDSKFVDIFTIIYYGLADKSNFLGRLQEINDRIANIKHGAGAVFVASSLSFMAWLVFSYYKNNFGTICIVWIILLVVIYGNYSVTRKRSENINNWALATFLFSEMENKTVKITIFDKDTDYGGKVGIRRSL